MNIGAFFALHSKAKYFFGGNLIPSPNGIAHRSFWMERANIWLTFEAPYEVSTCSKSHPRTFLSDHRFRRDIVELRVGDRGLGDVVDVEPRPMDRLEGREGHRERPRLHDGQTEGHLRVQLVEAQIRHPTGLYGEEGGGPKKRKKA